MYYTESYRKNLEARLIELREKKAEREAIMMKKKTHAELQKMIKKKAQLDDKLKLLQDIEQRRIAIINLNKIQSYAKWEENMQVHLDKVETIQMMRRSKSRKYRSVSKEPKQQKQKKQRFINSQEKLFGSTNHSFTQDEIGSAHKAQRKLDAQINKKNEVYKQLRFQMPKERQKYTLKLTPNSNKNRPASAHLTRTRKKQAVCQLSEELFEDISLDNLRLGKFDDSLKFQRIYTSKQKNNKQP